MIRETVIDREILASCPKGWFHPYALQCSRPEYRCARLEKLGLAEWRVVGEWPNTERQYRVTAQHG
jgi:hypothetical protein